ncbi:hypothetical protein SOASR031_12150 [Leminorella grimontii]|nr:hypothetical protein SOASR031_12150 [Leminorella grimontii]
MISLFIEFYYFLFLNKRSLYLTNYLHRNYFILTLSDSPSAILYSRFNENVCGAKSDVSAGEIPRRKQNIFP